MTEPILAVTLPAGRGRGYKHPATGEIYPSVTNVIEVMAKPWLAFWKAKMVAGYAWDRREALQHIERDEAVAMLKGGPDRKRDAAGTKGDVIHRYIEAHLSGEPLPDVDDADHPYIDAVWKFLEEYEPTFDWIEGIVFSDTYRYAGTFDWLGQIGPLRILADWKTGSGLYDEIALQLAALKNADSVWDSKTGDLSPMPKVDGCLGVHLQPGKYSVHVIDAGREAFEAFLGLREAWPWTKDHIGAVGPKMTPTRLMKAFGVSPTGDDGDGSLRSAPSPDPVTGSAVVPTGDQGKLADDGPIILDSVSSARLDKVMSTHSGPLPEPPLEDQGKLTDV